MCARRQWTGGSVVLVRTRRGQGFVVVIDQIPDNPRFDREAREQLLDVFRDAADFWGERRVPFRCFYSFQ